ncbi:MAG: hypothetical protein A2W28_07520, partial [Gammaproteobacteria bacterium RBG_16_51_14]
MAGGFIKSFRILILLYILFMVAVSSWLTRQQSTAWDRPLRIVIYPINGDGSEATRLYIGKLGMDTFQTIETFFDSEAERYKVLVKHPVDVYLSSEINGYPPQAPHGGSVRSIMSWSLKLRYWAWCHDNYDYPKDIQIFVQYYDPDTHERVAHSLGLQKGLVGVVNAFSSETMAAGNNVIIVHELLHTLGATDKYDPETNLPVYPTGYADPGQDPIFPQKKAEIMAGRIPIDMNNAEIPDRLQNTVIGAITAREIYWL